MVEMSGLCAYKDIFGKPGQGVHSDRFMDLAVVDTVLTVIGAVLIAWYFEWPLLYVMPGLFLLGIVLHHLFCVPTTVGKLLFGPKG